MKHLPFSSHRLLAALTALCLLAAAGGCARNTVHTDNPGPHHTDAKDGKDGGEVKVRNPGPRH